MAGVLAARYLWCMAPRAPAVYGWLLFSALFFLSEQAFSWVETAVRSHEARVEVAEDGRAVVHHQLVLKIRGGPMKSLEVSGIAGAVEPLADASVRPAVEGAQSQWPLKVAVQEDGALNLRILAERGLRGGSYLFSFAYALDLNEQGLIQAVPGGFEVTWVGPRLTTGVDSAKVTFSVPRAEQPPRIDEERGLSSGVLLGEVRRGASRDEIDLVRAHVASGEPAVWKVTVPSASLSTLAKRHAASERGPVLEQLPKKARILSNRAGLGEAIALSAAYGLLFALLVYFKFWQVRLLGRQADVHVKPLLPSPPWLRGLLTLGAVFAATYFSLELEPYLAVLSGAFAALLSTHLLPVRITRPRGPGLWEPVSEEQLRSVAAARTGWFEVRSLRGFGLFALLTGAILLVSYRVLPSSNYLALMSCASLVLVVPLFFSGRLSDFPEEPLRQSRPWLQFLTRAVDPEVVAVELWGRRSIDGDRATKVTGVYDETRVRLVMTAPPSGLRALEVALEEGPGATALPCVVLRVLIDSPAHQALPRDIPWTRGRTSEERVAILRPTAPTRAQVLRLVRSLLVHLRSAQTRASSTKARSSGSAEVASKGPTVAPAPAM